MYRFVSVSNFIYVTVGVSCKSWPSRYTQGWCRTCVSPPHTVLCFSASYRLKSPTPPNVLPEPNSEAGGSSKTARQQNIQLLLDFVLWQMSLRMELLITYLLELKNDVNHSFVDSEARLCYVNSIRVYQIPWLRCVIGQLIKNRSQYNYCLKKKV